MLVTLDTNVIVQALSSQRGASFKIVELVLTDQINLSLSVPVFKEYEDVLSRLELQQKLGFTEQDINSLLLALLRIGKRQSIYFLWRPNLPDEKDNLFVELAIASQSEYLITSNLKDFKNAELIAQSYQVINPAEFMELWRRQHE